MAISSKDIYKGRSKKKKKPFKILGIILVLAIIVGIVSFYLIKKTVVYDENGKAIITWKFVKSEKDERNIPGMLDGDVPYVPDGSYIPEATPEPVIDQSIAPELG